jgi:prepilin-type N-terminal cleavage/methylation domain-containing protein
MRRVITDERGLTLVEILIALVVIGLGLVGLAVVVPVSSYGMQEGNQLSTATFLAEQRLERARAADWTVTPPADCLGVSVGDTAPVPTGATCGGATTTLFPDEPVVGGYPGYGRVVRIRSCAVVACAGGVTHAGMRLVNVIVTYRGLTAAGQSTANKTVTLEWLVAQK